MWLGNSWQYERSRKSGVRWQCMYLRILPGKDCLVIGVVSFELSATLMHCLLNFLPGEMQGKSEYSKLLYSPRVVEPSTFTREEDIVWPTVVQVLFDVLGATLSRWCKYSGSTDETVSWNICCRLSLLCTALKGNLTLKGEVSQLHYWGKVLTDANEASRW